MVDGCGTMIDSVNAISACLERGTGRENIIVAGSPG